MGYVYVSDHYQPLLGQQAKTGDRGRGNIPSLTCGDKNGRYSLEICWSANNQNHSGENHEWTMEFNGGWHLYQLYSRILITAIREGVHMEAMSGPAAVCGNILLICLQFKVIQVQKCSLSLCMFFWNDVFSQTFYPLTTMLHGDTVKHLNFAHKRSRT